MGDPVQIDRAKIATPTQWPITVQAYSSLSLNTDAPFVDTLPARLRNGSMVPRHQLPGRSKKALSRPVAGGPGLRWRKANVQRRPAWGTAAELPVGKPER